MRIIKQVVYVDVLFALNMIISFFLISAAKRITGQSATTFRVLIGAVMGGAYSLVIFLPAVHTSVSFAFRLLFLLFLTAAVFGIKKVKIYFRCFAVICAVSFLLAGLLIAVQFFFSPQALLIKNGSVYFDVGFLNLVLSAAAVYAAVRLFRRFLLPEAAEKAECAVRLEYGGTFVDVKGIIDTGNTLTDSFTGKKVSVIDKSTAFLLLPEDAVKCLNSGDYEKMPPYMHLTVSSTVGGEGLLPVFTADLLTVTLNEKRFEIKNAAVAVSNSEAFGGFGVLINSDLTGDNTYDKKTDTKNKRPFFKKEKQVSLLHKRSADSAAAADRGSRTADNASH